MLQVFAMASLLLVESAPTFSILSLKHFPLHIGRSFRLELGSGLLQTRRLVLLCSYLYVCYYSGHQFEFIES